MRIDGKRYLVVVVGAGLVASLPPDCSPLGVFDGSKTADDVLKSCAANYPCFRDIFAIHSVFLIPFHVPTDVYMSVKINRDVFSTQQPTQHVRARSNSTRRGPQKSNEAATNSGRCVRSLVSLSILSSAALVLIDWESLEQWRVSWGLLRISFSKWKKHYQRKLSSSLTILT